MFLQSRDAKQLALPSVMQLQLGFDQPHVVQQIQ